MQPNVNGVYWIGQDGNVWVKGSDGNVSNMGRPTGTPLKSGIEAEKGSIGAWYIDDPNPGNGGGSSGSGSGGSNTTLNRAAIDATKQALGSLDTEKSVGYKNIEDNFKALLGGYDRERSQNREDYTEGTTTNSQNLTKNKQNALLAASQGLRGLRSVLAALGALGGTGSFLANRAVQTSANQDIGEASDTFATNSRNLDKAWSRFDTEDEQRRKEAQTTRENNRTALEGKILSKRQEIYQKLAELFGSGGDTAKAEGYLGAAGELNNPIAQKSRVGATPFVAKSAAFTPGDLATYLAGAGDKTVGVSNGASGSNGSLFYGPNLRKRKEATA